MSYQYCIHFTLSIILLNLLSVLLNNEGLYKVLLTNYNSDNVMVWKRCIYPFLFNFFLTNSMYVVFHYIGKVRPHIFVEKATNKLTQNKWIVIQSNFIINLLMGQILSRYSILNNHTDDPQNILLVIMKLAGVIVSEGVLFYTVHRALHSRYLKWIHKWHHEVVYTRAEFATYCSPIEQLLSNMFPILVPGTLMNVNSYLMMAWETIATINTLNAHSNLVLLKSFLADEHAIHHLSNKYNYGVFMWFDKYYNTYKTIKETRY